MKSHSSLNRSVSLPDVRDRRPRQWAGFLLLLCFMNMTPALAVVFTSDTLIETNNLTYEGQDMVVSGCTVTINGAHAFNSLTVTNSGVVTHSPCVYDSVTKWVDLTIATDVFVATGSAIDVSGKGYGSDTGPGKGGGGNYAGGGGYGGTGGRSYNGSGGGAYGAVLDPLDPGSGGGTGYDGNAGGAGGGAVRLVVGGQLQLDGSLLANGNNDGTYGGGGSGGSINLHVATLSGATTGLIEAKGGSTGAGGGGGGGRIAAYYGSSTYAGVWRASGGTRFGQRSSIPLTLKGESRL